MEPSQFDTQHLNKIAEKIEHKEKWFQERQCYATGANPVIFQELPKSAPDFRIPVPFVKKALQQYSGYMVKAGTITYTGKYYDSTLKPIYYANDEALVTSMCFSDALKFGTCYELHWTDNNGSEKQFYPIPTEQGKPVYSDDLKKKLIGFYWLREIEDDDKETYVLTYWDDTTQYEWRKPEGAKEWTAQQEVKHGYGQVPVNIGHIAEDKSNLFDHCKELIDLYDKLISGDVANESQRYVNALLLLADKMDDVTVDETGRTMVDRLRELMMLDGLGDDPGKKVAYLTKDIPTAFIEFACKTIYDLIHDMMPMIDARDDNLVATSGIAMRYKMMPFEYKCADIEANFNRFLYNRMYMIAGVTKSLGGSADGVFDVDIKWTRNLPENATEIADIATKLYGTLPDEIWIQLFPTSIVPDKALALKLMEANKPEVVIPENNVAVVNNSTTDPNAVS